MGKPAKEFRRAPAPYTKYKKRPYRYSEEYHRWKANRMKGDKIAGA